MTMNELYNHFNHNVYSTINWCTDPEVHRTLDKTRDEIKTIDEKPSPNRRRKNYPLCTLEYKDFRFVETLSTRAGDRGEIYYTPTGELVATDVGYYNYLTFVWWFYNHR